MMITVKAGQPLSEQSASIAVESDIKKKGLVSKSLEIPLPEIKTPFSGIFLNIDTGICLLLPGKYHSGQQAISCHKRGGKEYIWGKKSFFYRFE